MATRGWAKVYELMCQLGLKVSTILWLYWNWDTWRDSAMNWVSAPRCTFVHQAQLRRVPPVNDPLRENTARPETLNTLPFHATKKKRPKPNSGILCGVDKDAFTASPQSSRHTPPKTQQASHSFPEKTSDCADETKSPNMMLTKRTTSALVSRFLKTFCVFVEL